MAANLPQQEILALPNVLASASESAGAGQAQCLAHDARNWLTILQVYCDLLRTREAPSREEQQAWMKELARAVERGQGLITSLLASIRPEEEASASEVDLEPEATDLPVVLHQQLPLLQRLAGESIRVELSSLPHSGRVAMSRISLERVLDNLVRNAIEAMPHGGRLRLSLRRSHRCRNPRAGATERMFVLRVRDTGPGIAPELLPVLFQPGISSKPRAAGQQRGLGLAIVRELVEKAGGQIRVRSQANHGCCFEVELPRLEELRMAG